MTDYEMLLDLETLTSSQLLRAIMDYPVKNLMQAAFDNNIIFLCPAEPDPTGPESYRYSYLDYGKKWYYILFTSTQRYQKCTSWPDRVQPTPIHFRDLFLDVKQRKNFAGFAINPAVSPSGTLDPGYLVKLRGEGRIQILQANRTPSANYGKPETKAGKQMELWVHLHAAISIPDRKIAKEAVVDHLQYAYEEDIGLPCVVLPDPDDAGMHSKVLVHRGKRQYFILLTQDKYLEDCKAIVKKPEIVLSVVQGRDFLDEMFRRSDVSGITFNLQRIPPNTATGFLVNKRDLSFGKQSDETP